MDELKINQQAGVISTNLDEIEAEIKAKMEEYKDYLVTEDTVASDKKVLAELRKLLKSLNDARIATKKQWLEPFEEFEARCKSVQALVEEPINLINDQIKLFDEEKKLAKQEHIKELFEANLQGFDRFFSFDKVIAENPKWLNLSTKDQDILFDLNGMVLKVKNDIEAIKALGSEIEEDCITAYIKSNNNLSVAIQRNTQYLSDKAKVVEHVKEEKVTEPVKEEPKSYDYAVKIVISKENLEQVKELLDFSNIQYKVEGV